MIKENLSIMALWLDNNGQSKQAEMYNTMADMGKEIKMCKINDVLPDYILHYIKTLNPQPKQCYKNSTLLATAYPDEIGYCEGKVYVLDALDIDHAWNVYTDNEGKKYYFDITFEVALCIEDVDSNEYFMIAEFTADEAIELTMQKMTYGDLWMELYRKEHKNPSVEERK